MDQLMSDFSPPRVSTSFEKKVGASLCKASELAMSDKLPKFRLVSAPTGGSKTTSSIALLAMLANEDKGFTGAYICKTIEECEYVIHRHKMNKSQLRQLRNMPYFNEDAIREIAKKAIFKKTGARGLRSIIEDSLMDLMYKVPDQKDLYKVVINKDVISKKSDPILIYSNKENSQKLMSNNS